MATNGNQGKPASADDIMASGELRALLKLAKGGNPLSCVVCVSGDGEGVILVRKQSAPKKLRGELTAKAGKIDLDLDDKTLRYGRATVDDTDEALLRLAVNKEPSGEALHAAIKRRVKTAGFSDVLIIHDPDIDKEPEDDGRRTDPNAVGQSAQPSPTPAAKPPVDATLLQSELANLIHHLSAASAGNAERFEALKRLAAQAAESIKAHHLDEAVALLADLKNATATSPASRDGAGPGAALPPTGPTAPALDKGAFVAMQKSRLAWESARSRVASEIKSLKDAVSNAFDDDPEEFEVIDALDELDEILENLDERLLETLDDMLKETDPATHAELLSDAKGLIAEYSEYATKNELLAGLQGETPFGITLTIASTITGTLKVLKDSLR